MKRRDFVALSLLSFLSSCNVQAKSKNPNIIIIGAGIAGLAAGFELVSTRFNVILLEARGRIGGRVHTDNSLGIPLDLGGQWIHGIRGNPITKIAREHQIKLQKTDYENYELFDKRGNPIPTSQLNQAESLYEQFITQSEKLLQQLDKDISIQAAVDQIIPKKQQTPLFNWYLISTFVTDIGADLNQISLSQLDEGEGFEGGDYLFPQGYHQIAQILAKGLNIKLNHQVTKIDYSNPSSISITTNQGIFKADAVIITLPLGVLQKNLVEFVPTLPSSKQTAINRLKMGLLNKIILKFPRIFWSTEPDLISNVSEQPLDIIDFLNLAKYNNDPILMGFIGGSAAVSYEKLSESQISNRVIRILRRIYGSSIPNPSAIIKTQWLSDRFSNGSYSYVPVGVRGTKERLAIAQPIDNRLFFAGEATSVKYSATVHGAFLSGISAAQNLIKIYQ